MLSKLVETDAFQTALLYAGYVLVAAGVILMAVAVYTYRKLGIRAVRADLSGKTRAKEVSEIGREQARTGGGRRVPGGAQEAGAAPKDDGAAVFIPLAEQKGREPLAAEQGAPSAPRPAVQARPEAAAEPAATPNKAAARAVAPSAAPAAAPAAPAQAPQRKPMASITFVVTKRQIAPDRVDVLENEE